MKFYIRIFLLSSVLITHQVDAAWPGVKFVAGALNTGVVKTGSFLNTYVNPFSVFKNPLAAVDSQDLSASASQSVVPELPVAPNDISLVVTKVVTEDVPGIAATQAGAAIVNNGADVAGGVGKFIADVVVPTEQPPVKTPDVANIVIAAIADGLPEKMKDFRTMPLDKFVKKQGVGFLANIQDKAAEYSAWAEQNPEEAVKKAAMYALLGTLGIYAFMKLDENFGEIKNFLHNRYKNNQRFFDWLGKGALAAAIGGGAYYAYKNDYLHNDYLHDALAKIPAIPLVPVLQKVAAPFVTVGTVLKNNAKTIGLVAGGTLVAGSALGACVYAAAENSDDCELVKACKELLTVGKSERDGRIQALDSFVTYEYKGEASKNIRTAIFGDKSIHITGVIPAFRNWENAQSNEKNTAKEKFYKEVHALKHALRFSDNQSDYNETQETDSI